MNKFQLIRINDRDRLGKYYLEKAIHFTLEKQFSKAYEYLKEGLDFLTCDCLQYNWYKEINDNTFIDIEINNTHKIDYYFVKAFFLSYKPDIKNLYVALDAIDIYLKYFSKEDYGYYLKGKILLKLKEFEQAHNFLEKAVNINRNSRNCYWLGRVKEIEFNQDGLELIFDSLKQNYTSVCAWRFFKERIDFHDVALNANKENIIYNSFIVKGNTINFINLLFKNINDSIDNYESFNIVLDFFNIVNTSTSSWSHNEQNYDDDDNWENSPYNRDNFEENYNTYSESDSYYNDQLDMDQQSQDFWESL